MMFGMTSFRVLFRGYYKYCECGCKILIKILRKNGEFRRFKKGHHMFGYRNPNWIGGLLKPNNSGYNRVRTNNNYRLYHRFVYEEYYHVCLLYWIDIHHKNGDKTDNRIENLLPIMKSEHTKLEKTKDKTDRFCVKCSKKTSIKNNGYEGWYGNSVDGWICNRCYMVEYRKKTVKSFIC